MPNTLITPTVVARATLGFWQDQAVLPGLFSRAYESEFGGGSGDTITIRKQASLVAKKYVRATGLEVQDIVEDKITLTVDDLYDVTVKVTTEQWDFDVLDFNYQVAEPAARALARQAEAVIAAALVTHSTIMDLDVTSAETVKRSFVTARQTLNENETPMSDRFIIAGTTAAAEILNALLPADVTGDNTALRNAQIGRLLGMPVYESVVVADNEAYVCHRDALAFVSVTPAIPRGAANASTAAFEGLSSRVVFDYDVQEKSDIVCWDSYYECASLRGESAFVRLAIPGAGALAATKSSTTTTK